MQCCVLATKSNHLFASASLLLIQIPYKHSQQKAIEDTFADKDRERFMDAQELLLL